jgi:hypothetical protein
VPGRLDLAALQLSKLQEKIFQFLLGRITRHGTNEKSHFPQAQRLAKEKKFLVGCAIANVREMHNVVCGAIFIET